MDRHSGDSGRLQRFGKLHAVTAPRVPASSEFRSHRHGDGLYHGLHNPSRLVRVFHQGGAVAIVHNLRHGTAHIDINEVRTGGLQSDLGGLRHTDWIAAKNLHRAGMLSWKLPQQGKCFLS